jgi:hypothetical protein
MTFRGYRFVGAVTVVACLVGHASILCAQSVEVAPFGGYRFGGDFFEIITGRPVDLDGALSMGIVLDVPLSGGLQFEGLFSHQQADVSVPGQPFQPATHLRMSVDHWQGGALQEFGWGRLRPFVTGSLGLTRYAAAADSEVRFSVAGGGGMKVFATPHVGLRLDGRVFATLVDAEGTVIACSRGTCLLAIHADVVWQAEFTAGVVVRFP